MRMTDGGEFVGISGESQDAPFGGFRFSKRIDVRRLNPQVDHPFPRISDTKIGFQLSPNRGLGPTDITSMSIVQRTGYTRTILQLITL